jgi:hypothetical protein
MCHACSRPVACALLCSAITETSSPLCVINHQHQHALKKCQPGNGRVHKRARRCILGIMSAGKKCTAWPSCRSECAECAKANTAKASPRAVLACLQWRLMQQLPCHCKAVVRDPQDSGFRLAKRIHGGSGPAGGNKTHTAAPCATGCHTRPYACCCQHENMLHDAAPVVRHLKGDTTPKLV